ncbi:unnamed protein product [Caenorhabditis brenneri]
MRNSLRTAHFSFVVSGGVGPSCTPSTPRTYLHAYSTDLSPQNGYDFYDWTFPSKTHLWNTYAYVRLDMKNGDDIHYFKDRSAFNQSVLSNLPDPSLGYMDNTTGSDMFDMLQKFLKKTENLCGSTVIIAAKRYPNEVEIEDLISDLQKNHVFVYILSSDNPSGGSNPLAMFNVATRTNGYCVFGPDDYLHDMYLEAENLAASPNQIAASKFAVSGNGRQTVPIKTLGDPVNYDHVEFEVVFQDHKVDGSLIALNYTITDEFGGEQQFFENHYVLGTAYHNAFSASYAVQYYLNINYEYQKGLQEVMVVRVYDWFYIPDNWLPFNN